MQLAGFHVTGVDLRPQPRYVGDAFHRADALEFPLDGFDFVWASPPCQAYIRSGMVAKDGRHPNLLPLVRERLLDWGGAWVIENVPGAPLRRDVVLCGSMFGLAIQRHRWFETHPRLLALTRPCNHSRPITGVYGHPHGKGGAWRNGKRPMLPSDMATWSREMGIDWMNARELGQAIPPAYATYLGRQIIAALEAAA